MGEEPEEEEEDEEEEGVSEEEDDDDDDEGNFFCRSAITFFRLYSTVEPSVFVTRINGSGTGVVEVVGVLDDDEDEEGVEEEDEEDDLYFSTLALISGLWYNMIGK